MNETIQTKKQLQYVVCLTCGEIWIDKHKPYKDTPRCKFGCVCSNHHSPNMQFSAEKVREALDTIDWEAGLREFTEELETYNHE